MFLDKYKSCNKITFKQYKIDDSRNLFLLEELHKIIVDFHRMGETLILTGSIALFLKYNKIYRTFKDIDLLIKNSKTEKIKYLNYFNKKYLLSFNAEFFSSAREYLQYSLSDDKNNILSLHSLDTKIQVDLAPIIRDEGNLSLEYLSLEYLSVKDKFHVENIKVGCVLPLKYYDKAFSYERIVDNDDLEFYNKYILNN